MPPENDLRIGILHPGAMGISVAASALNSGHEVFWASEGRSNHTVDRARALALTELDTVAELCARTNLILSVCPPHAALTKGATALLCAVLGAAESLDVRSELYEQWTRDDHNSVERNETRVQRTTAKAWRFEGKMREIADTLEAAGMPGGFHRAAAEIYHRLASLKDTASPVSMTAILDALTK